MPSIRSPLWEYATFRKKLDEDQGGDPNDFVQPDSSDETPDAPAPVKAEEPTKTPPLVKQDEGVPVQKPRINQMPMWSPDLSDAALKKAQEDDARSKDFHTGMSQALSLFLSANGSNALPYAQAGKDEEPHTLKDLLQRRQSFMQTADYKKKELADQLAADKQDPNSGYNIVRRKAFASTEMGKALADKMGDSFNQMTADQLPALNDMFKDELSSARDKQKSAQEEQSLAIRVAALENQKARLEAMINDKALDREQRERFKSQYEQTMNMLAGAKALQANIAAKRLDLDLKTRNVPGLEMQDGYALSKTEAPKMRALLPQSLEFDDEVKELKDLFNQTGSTFPNSTTLARMNSLRASITGKSNLIQQLGGLTEGHQEILQSELPSPATWGSRVNPARYNALLDDLLTRNERFRGRTIHGVGGKSFSKEDFENPQPREVSVPAISTSTPVKEPAQFAGQVQPEDTKVIGGKTYVKIGGEWHVEE